jgi:WD40 repeat protein
MSDVTVQKLHTITGHRDCIYTLAPFDDAHRFFSASGDGMIVLWDLTKPDEGELVAKLPNSVYALHYSHDANVLLAGHNYEGIHLLDVQNKKEKASLQLTTAAIFDIASLGNFAFVACGDGTLVKVDLDQLSIMSRVKHSEKSARALAVNESRGELAVGYSDYRIRIFDFNLNLLREIEAHANSVFTVRYSPDGQYLVSGSRDARLKFWSTGNGYQLANEIVAHMFAINHLDYSPDNKHFVTCSLDKTVKVWDATEQKLLKVIDRARHGGHLTSVNKVLWTSYGDQLISASDDRTISVWHMIF